MKAERDASSGGRRRARYREQFESLLDPPIEALDKATASTKISDEQCTWPDSDRVKCHRASSPPPLPRPFVVPRSRIQRRRLAPDFARASPLSSLPSFRPSFFFPLPVLFSFSYDRRRARDESSSRQFGIGALGGNCFGHRLSRVA